MDFTKIEAEIKIRAEKDSRSGIDEYSGDENLSYVRTSTTHQQQEGILWITLNSKVCWNNTSPWDDYSGYDEEETIYSWIGLASTLSNIMSIEHLKEWANYTYIYKARIIKSDARYECSHEGIQVKSFVDNVIVLETATKAKTEWSEELRGVYPQYFFSEPQKVIFRS